LKEDLLAENLGRFVHANSAFRKFAHAARAVHEKGKIMQKSGLHEVSPRQKFKDCYVIFLDFQLWLIPRLVHDIPRKWPTLFPAFSHLLYAILFFRVLLTFSNTRAFS